jgi:DNA-binding response OmpR family regulator
MAQGIVLLVDDDWSLLEALSEVLRDEGFLVVPAGNGTEAWNRFAEHPVDAAILDLNLGRGESGVGVCARLREQRPDLPVLFITAQPECYFQPLTGRTALMRKPLNLPRLFVVLRNWLDEEPAFGEDTHHQDVITP